MRSDQKRDQRAPLAQGFRFYLPAFMVFCITDFARTDVMADSVISNLTLPRMADFEEMRKRMDDFRANSPEDARSPPDELYESVMASQAEFYYSGEYESFILTRLIGFTREQGKVIRLYLEYMRDVHGDEFPQDEPQTAIDRYWHDF